MLKKSITYTDYNGEKQTEDFYFNLSKAELIEMQTSVDGGLDGYLIKLVQRNKQPELMAFFKDLILKSYGEKSADGRRFIKSKQLSEEFSQTEAYSELFTKLTTDSTAAAEFVNGIMPAGFMEQAQAMTNASTEAQVLSLDKTE